MGIRSEEMAVGMRMRRRFTPIVWDPRGSRHWRLGHWEEEILAAHCMGGRWSSGGARYGEEEDPTVAARWREVAAMGRNSGRCGVHKVTGRRGAWLGLGSLPPTDMERFFLKRRFLKYREEISLIKGSDGS
uniref:Uncharacterized protein n=1 Tax=Oryza meridionalis TaxID=40149 RepID=A0A0E0C5L3_9ORYZ